MRSVTDLRVFYALRVDFAGYCKGVGLCGLNIGKLVTPSISDIYYICFLLFHHHHERLLTKDRLPGLEQSGGGSLSARAQSHRGAARQPPLLLLGSG